MCQAGCKTSSVLLHFSRPSFSLAIISQHFSLSSPPIRYLSSSLAANDLSPHPIEKTGVSRIELSQFLSNLFT